MGAEQISGPGNSDSSRKTDIVPAADGYQAVRRDLAEQAREKRDGFHLTEKARNEAQKAFEKEQRIYDRSRGVVASSLYSHEHIRMRETNERDDQIQADAMNARRSILDRLRGKNKITSYDVLRDEADRMNTVTDHLVMEGRGTISPQEAHDEIARSTEFLPEQHSAMLEMGNQEGIPDLLARLHKANPYIESALNTGHAEPLRDFVEKEKDRARSTDEIANLDSAFTTLVQQKMDTFIRSRDVASVINLLESKGVYIPLSEDMISQIPQEFIRYMEVQRALRNRIAEYGGQNTAALNEALERRKQEPA